MGVSNFVSSIGYKSRLKKYYKDSIVPMLMEQCSFSNIMQVPKIKKIVISTTDKDCISDTKVIDKMFEQLFLIAGQKPVKTSAKNANAGFKLRKGMQIGCKVTLRNDLMYDFLDKLINIALPRMKDFYGFGVKQFDGHGNYSIGFKEQIIFPEINYDKIDKIRGMNIVIVTNDSCTDEQSMALLKMFNFPFNQD